MHSIPTKLAKRLVVLDHLAQNFELGVVYPESEVNAALFRFHPDVPALRRYLVDERFLTRRDGFLLALRRDSSTRQPLSGELKGGEAPMA